MPKSMKTPICLRSTNTNAVKNQTNVSADNQGTNDNLENEEGKTNLPESKAPDGAKKSSKVSDDILSRIISFRPFTEESFRRLCEKEVVEKAMYDRQTDRDQEAHLVDGELIFGSKIEEGIKPPLPPNPDLTEGKSLREEHGIFPADYFGQPLEEIDKAIEDKTFVVIGRKFRSMNIFRFSGTSAFYLFPPWGITRRVALHIATHQLFDFFIIITILVNCIFLAMPELSIAESSEYAFLGIYMVEMVIKMTARGFVVHRHTYLRDPWNWLDFIVIVSASLTIIIQLADSNVSVGNLQGLRTFRVFRALKTVSIVPDNWQLDDTGDYLLCGNSSGTGSCNTNYTCLGNVGENPNYGLTSFDNFGWCMLTTFQLLTLDFWEDTYNKVIRTSGPWNVFLFLVIIFFGAFYLLNLMLAVVAMSYEEEALNTNKESERNRLAEEKQNKKKSVYDIASVAAKTKQLREHARELVEKKQARKEEGMSPDRNETQQKTNARSSKTVDIDKSITMSPKESVNPDKPLVKIPSMDSGYSSQSQKSNPENLITNQLTEKSSSEIMDTTNNLQTAILDSPVDCGYVTTSTSHVTFKTDKSVEDLNRGIDQQNSTCSVTASGSSSVQVNGDIIIISDTTMSVVHSSATSTSATSSSASSSSASSSSASSSSDVSSSFSSSSTVSSSSVNSTDAIDDEMDDIGGVLVDRNCSCCRECCLCLVLWLKLENFLYQVVSDPLFDLVVTLCIVLNTIFLAIEHHGMSDDLAHVLTVGNYVFSGVFIIEAILKIIAMNKYYFYNGWNIFDLIIVIASVIDMGVESISGLSVLRTFRLLRVVKLAQSWPTMRILLTIIINTLGQLGYLTIILFIMIYIFAVMGLQLFREKYQKFDFGDTEAKRWHFKDFYHSFMMIFRVLCGEWVEPLWQCVRASNELCMVVFLPALVIGNFIVLNLFLALLINAFASDTIDKHKHSVKDANRLAMAFKRLWLVLCSCALSDTNTVKPSKPEVINGAKRVLCDLEENKSKAITATRGYADNVRPRKATAAIESEIGVDTSFQSSRRAKDENYNAGNLKPGERRNSDNTRSDSKLKSSENDDLKLGDTAESLGIGNPDLGMDKSDKTDTPPDCFPLWLTSRFKRADSSEINVRESGWNQVRCAILRVVDSRYFEWLVLFLIFSSSIALAFEDVYMYQKVELMQALYILNILFCVLFGVEMLLKWLAYGVTHYFTRFWTILDFCIVVISVASLLGESFGVTNITAFRSLRTLRALRPLRAISRWQGMRIVVNSLMMAIPAIINVILVGMMFWLIFSIMGVQFFSGRFYKCVNSTSGDVLSAGVTPNKSSCLSIGETWRNSKVNFDNAGAGLLALFQVATFEGWMEIMRDAVDVTDVDIQPVFEASKYSYLYFVIFIIFGAFFTLNLFISVIIDNFNVLKKRYEGSYYDAFLTESQRKYYNTLKKLGNKKPQKTIKRPQARVLVFFYKLAMSTKFELAIVLLIALNMVVMAVEHYKQTDAVTQTLNLLNVTFTTVFLLEAGVKLLGLRWHYFRVPWNVFDLFIVILSLSDIFLADVLSSVIIKPTLLRVIRVFRIGRVLRLIKAAKGIRKLLFALIISLPAIINIGALLFLIMYIYAIIGMSSFGDVKLNGALNDLTNFQTFGNSFLLLIRLSTSGGWNDILDALLVDQSDGCNPNYRTLPNGELQRSAFGDCGIAWLAVPFMTSYIIVVFLIVINMYIAVILENFNQAHQQEEVGITEDDFDMFYNVWERYDPHASQFIKYDQLSDFVADLEPPLCLEKPNEIKLVSFNLSIMDGDKMHCLDILMALIKNFLSDVEESEELNKLKLQMGERFSELFPSRHKLKVKSTTLQRKKEDVATRTLQRAWKHHKTQKALKNIAQLAVRQNSLRKDSFRSDRDSSPLSGVLEIGRKMSNALTTFFDSSRRSSSVSHVSSRSQSQTPNSSQHMTLMSLSNRTFSKNLQLPEVNTLYGESQSTHSRDFDL